MKKVFQGRRFSEVELGEIFYDSMTVTETHLILGCGLFKDFNPLHSDKEFSKRSIFKNRILHGPMISAVMIGLVGNYFADWTIAFVEHRTQFKTPVKLGDTLNTEWELVGKEPKAKYRGGIVSLRGICKNQNGKVVAEAEGKILISNEPI